MSSIHHYFFFIFSTMGMIYFFLTKLIKILWKGFHYIDFFCFSHYFLQYREIIIWIWFTKDGIVRKTFSLVSVIMFTIIFKRVVKPSLIACISSCMYMNVNMQDKRRAMLIKWTWRTTNIVVNSLETVQMGV